MRAAVALLVCMALTACGRQGADLQGQTHDESPGVRTGADMLVAEDFSRLHGKRVGLIANQTSVSGGRHLADLLHEHDLVELSALFGPEHGLRGDAAAGSAIADGRDDRTGVPVYSLYGSRRAPGHEVLESVDVLVFDIQDIGTRFYTYIATMGLAMEAAASAGVPFMVLDRPNPLGGAMVDGFVLEKEHESFVGPYPIPVQHGMTVGELARMVLAEGWIDAGYLDLEVVPVEGWTREMLWPDTGLEWIPTSPNIPDFETALVYPGLGFLEATTWNEGRGTLKPFLQFGAPALDGPLLASRLLHPGVAFVDTAYTPVSMPGRAEFPRHQDERVTGVRLSVSEAALVRPLALGMEILVEVVRLEGPSSLRESGMARLAGTTRLYESLLAGLDGPAIAASWATEVVRFREQRSPYLLYR